MTTVESGSESSPLRADPPARDDAAQDNDAQDNSARGNGTLDKGALDDDGQGGDSERQSQQMGFFAQIIRFGLVGVFCAIIDFSIYQGLRSLGWEAAPWEDMARGISFIIGTTTAYFLNKRFTFSATATGGAKQAGSFWLVYVLTFVGAVFVNRLGLQVLPPSGWESTIAWVVSQGTATAINFLMLRLVVYRART